jgi:hypothetical protein
VPEGASLVMVRFGASGSMGASPTSRAHPVEAIPTATTSKAAIPECAIVRTSMLSIGCQEDTPLLLKLPRQIFIRVAAGPHILLSVSNATNPRASLLRHAGRGAGGRVGAGLAVRHLCPAHGTACKRGSRKCARRWSSHPRLGRCFSYRRLGSRGSAQGAPGHPRPAYHYQHRPHQHRRRGGGGADRRRVPLA